MPWAIDVTGYVNDHSDLDVTLWSATFGYPVGTMAWSSLVESEVALADGTAKLLVDDGYLSMLDQAESFVTQPGQDLLREMVHGQPGDPPPIGAVATITTAHGVGRPHGRRVGLGCRVAQYVEGATGVPIAVLTNVYGQMGEIAWIGVRPDIAAAEAVRTKLGGDADYLGRMVATKDLFVPASGHVSLVTRLA